MKRIYMVWLNYYDKDEVYEKWAIKREILRRHWKLLMNC